MAPRPISYALSALFVIQSVIGCLSHQPHELVFWFYVFMGVCGVGFSTVRWRHGDNGSG